MAIRRDVDDLLEEYKNAAGDRLKVEYVDPASSPLEEQKVAMIGIPPIQINVIRRDKQEVAKIYLGMALLYGDKQQVIPVIQRTANLEYVMDESILKIASKSLPKIAWWEPEKTNQSEGNGYSFMRGALAERYSVEEVGSETRLDPKIHSAFVLLSPRKMGKEFLEMLGGYLAGGGRVIALVDRFAIGTALELIPVETDVIKQLVKYGIFVEDAIALDELSATAPFSGGVVTYHIQYPYWIDVRRGGLNQNLPITSELESIVMPWSSPIEIAGSAKPAGPAAVVARTTAVATSVPASDVRLDPKLANEALSEGEHRRLVIAALVDGPSDASKLFVAGSSHWATDRFISMFPQNAALFQNAVDYFAMGEMLIGIRSRMEMGRPIIMVPDAARFWLKYMNLATGPIAVAILGVLVLILRRTWRRQAVRRYG
jgi:ABC-type uncharacterized transport system involved in gliding motility auxiliary subunit